MRHLKGILLLLIIVVLPLILESPKTISSQEASTVIVIVDDFTGEVNLPALARELTIDTAAPTSVPGRPSRPPRAPITDFSTYVQLSNARVTRAEEVISERGLVNRDTDPETPDNCAVTLEGQVYATRGAGTDENLEEAKPHGVYVREAVEAEIDHLQLEDVEVVEVNIPAFDTTSIVGDIQSTLARYQKANVVVNMSFSIIPCDLLATLASAEVYAEQLANDENFEALEAFRASIAEYFEENVNAETIVDDAIRSLIARFDNDDRQMIFIGASGNYGQDFSFLPAAWPEVLSIGASTKPSEGLLAVDEPAEYSNLAQIIVPLFPESPLGTSFAAPRVSALLAAVLTKYSAADSCDGQGVSALLELEFEDYTIIEAFEQSCPDLLVWLNEVIGE